MRLVPKILFGSLVAGLVFVVGGAVLLAATPFGNRLLLDQSEALATTLLPPDVAMSVGSRTIGFAQTGEITIRYHDVVLRQRESQNDVATIGDLAVGFSLIAALTGDISADMISADRVRIDTAVLNTRSGFTAPNAEAIFAALDAGAASGSSLPLKAIEIGDLAPLGAGSQVPHISRLRIDRTETGKISLVIAGDADGVTFGAEGTAQISGDGRRIEALALRTDKITLPVEDGSPVDAPSLSLSLGLAGTQGKRRLRLTSAGRVLRAAGERIDGTMAVELGEGEDHAAMTAEFADGKWVSGRFTGALDLTELGNGTLPFELASNELTSKVASIPQALAQQASAQQASPSQASALPGERRASFAARGVIDMTRGSVRLEDAELRVGKGWMRADADLGGFGVDDRLTVNLSGEAIDSADLTGFWPFFIADSPRAWTMENLRAGTIDTASIALNLTVERLLESTRPDTPMREDEFALSLAFTGGAFNSLDTMPDLIAASGTIRHRGGRVAIALTEAKLEGEADIAVLPSSVDFQDVPGGVDVAVSLNVEGPAANLLALADRQPMMEAKDRPWQPEDLSGNAQVGVGVGFHLDHRKDATDDPSIDALNWSIVTELKGVDLKKPIEGRKLSGLIGTAIIAEGSAIGQLTGQIDGIPANVNFAQPIGQDPVGERSLKIAARLDERAIAHLSPSLAKMIDGVITVDLVQTKDGFSAKADLTKAAIFLPAIGWSKSAGIAGSISFKIAPDGNVVKLQDAVLRGDGFSATGSAELDGAGLKSLVLNSLALNRDDTVSARLTRIPGGVGLSVAANGMDARPILAALKKSITNDGANSSSDKEKLILELSAGRMRGFGNEALENAEIRYESDGGSVSSASLAASIRGAPVTLKYEPAAKSGPDVRLDVADTGALLRFSGLYAKMRDGHLKMNLGTRDGAFSGGVIITDFTLVDEERLRSLVGTAQQSSDTLAARLGTDLPAASAYFDIARAKLQWRSGRLVIDDGIIRGPVFGSSFAGTLVDPSGRIAMAGSFMPAYGVNRLFGALPLVGQVLGNGGEGGLIGITYRLEGTLADPTLVVNPISLIAPGIFRRIFEY